MAHASITEFVLVDAPPDVVWSVISDPAQIPILDPRVSVLSTSGEQGTLGSRYVLRASRGRRSVDMHYRVIEAVAPSMLSIAVRVGGKDWGFQEATLDAEGDGSRLVWTARTSTPFGTAAVARHMMRREMRPWLEAVAAHSTSRS